MNFKYSSPQVAAATKFTRLSLSQTNFNNFPADFVTAANTCNRLWNSVVIMKSTPLELKKKNLLFGCLKIGNGNKRGVAVLDRDEGVVQVFCL